MSGQQVAGQDQLVPGPGDTGVGADLKAERAELLSHGGLSAGELPCGEDLSGDVFVSDAADGLGVVRSAVVDQVVRACGSETVGAEEVVLAEVVVLCDRLQDRIPGDVRQGHGVSLGTAEDIRRCGAGADALPRPVASGRMCLGHHGFEPR